MSRPVTYDGLDQDALRRALAVPRVELLEEVTSTQDAAVRLADAGAAAGTIVLANQQTAGRGRGGNAWASEAGGGVWLTVVERPASPSGAAVLSLRLGLRLARALEAFAAAPVRLKWPNDVYAGAGKVAGILVESRWRQQTLEWTAIGVGVNLRPPVGLPTAAGLAPTAERLEVLRAVVAASRDAAAQEGALAPDELAAFAARDFAWGRRCRAPGVGTVRGITADGALLVETSGTMLEYRTGSLLLEDA